MFNSNVSTKISEQSSRKQVHPARLKVTRRLRWALAIVRSPSGRPISNAPSSLSMTSSNSQCLTCPGAKMEESFLHGKLLEMFERSNKLLEMFERSNKLLEMFERSNKLL